MKKLVLIFLVVTVVVAGAILFFNRTERSPVGAELLPDNTLVFMDVPDFQVGRAQLANSPLAALWAEPEMQAFFQKPITALRESTGGEERLQEMLALPQGEAFVAITRFAATPKIDLTGVVGIDCKLRKAQAYAYLKIYEHQLAKYSPHAQQDQKKYLGISYTTITASPTSHLNFGFLGTMLVATTDEDQMRDMITRYTGNAPPDDVTLAGSPRYRNVISRLPEAPAGRAFVNVEQLVNQYGMLLLMATQGSPALQSINNVQAASATVSFNETGELDTTVRTYAKPHHPDAPIQRRTLVAAPRDSALYAVQTTDLAGNFTKLMEALAKSGNTTAMQIGGNLDKFLADAGVRLGDDFLAHLGPEVAYVGNWRDGARAPDFALVVEVKDRAALAAKFDTIAKAVRQSVSTSDVLEHDGETLYVIRTGSSYAAPTFVLTEKFFVLALTPDYAKEIVSQIKSGTNSLADAADFRSAAQHIPPGGSSFTYCDLRKVIGGLYVLGHANATNTDSFLPWNKLPQPATITRHLGPYVSTTVENAQASTTTSYSPIGKPMALVVALTGGIAAAQPLIARLPPGLLQSLPTMSSGTAAPPPPPDNQTATSQTPATR